MNKFIFILLIIVIFSSTVEASTYRVYVDKEFGFFGVRENSTNFTDYSNHTLYINVGDKVEWENFVATDERVTLISDNKLWKESDAILGWNYKIFRYTFNKTGTYKIHIKENQIFRLPENYTINSTTRIAEDTVNNEGNGYDYGYVVDENHYYDYNYGKVVEKLPAWFIYQVYVPTRYLTIIVGKELNTNNNNIDQKVKNKIIAKNSVHVSNSEINVDDEEQPVSQAISVTEKKVSPYEKYTLLELIKSIFKRT